MSAPVLGSPPFVAVAPRSLVFLALSAQLRIRPMVALFHRRDGVNGLGAGVVPFFAEPVFRSAAVSGDVGWRGKGFAQLS